MIVVAIIGVLATIAIPQYQDYTVRAKVSEAILATTACRNDIQEFASVGMTAISALETMRGCGSVSLNRSGSAMLLYVPRDTQYVNNMVVFAHGVVEVSLHNLGEPRNIGVPRRPQRLAMIPYA